MSDVHVKGFLVSLSVKWKTRSAIVPESLNSGKYDTAYCIPGINLLCNVHVFKNGKI